jgi:ferredoxin
MSKKKRDENIIGNFFKEDAQEVRDLFKSDVKNEILPDTTVLEKIPFPVLPKTSLANDIEIQAYWRTLRSFFRSGKGGGLPVFKDQPLIYPVHLASIKKKMIAVRNYPFWIADSAEDNNQTHGALYDMLRSAIHSIAPRDNEAKTLKDNLPRLEAIILDKLKDIDTPLALNEILEPACMKLKEQLSIPGDEGDRLNADLQQLLKNLPGDGKLIGYSEKLPFYLLAAAINAYRVDKIENLKVEIEHIKSQVNDLLAVEKDKSPEAVEPEHLQEVFDFADSYINFEELSTVVPAAGSELMPAERHERLEWVLQSLDNAKRVLFDQDFELILSENFVEENSLDLISIFPRGVINYSRDGDLCVMAMRRFDEVMTTVMPIFIALRIAKLEVRNEYISEVHGDYFAHFDWRSLTESEMACCPQLIVMSSANSLLGEEMTHFSYMLSTYRPIKILAVKKDAHIDYRKDANNQDSELIFQQELGAIGVSHRHTFVMQSTGITPSQLLNGFMRGFNRTLPSLFYLMIPETKEHTPLDQYLWTSALVEGRCFPYFIYDSEKSERWGSRFEIGDNPDADTEWPQHLVRVHENEDSFIDWDLPFTFADFAAQDPEYSDQFIIVPPKYWTDDLVPIADFLSMDYKEAYSKVPFIWMVDDKNELTKVAVSRKVVLSSKERLDFWDYLQENAGINSFHVEQAVKEIRQEMEEKIVADLNAQAEKHAIELEQVKNNAAGEAMEHLAAILLDLETTTAAGTFVSSQSTEEEKQGEPEKESAEASEELTAIVEEEEDSDATFQSEAWIESSLCTTCNECTDINKRIFKYNAEKLAYVADPKGGPFADIVQAAEACPAGIIHPGSPQDPNEKDLDELIRRAEPFNQ